MTQTMSSEMEHCRELALQPGGVFEFTSRFLTSDILDKYVVLYALKQAICTIPMAHVDDAVKWEKLRWWGEEILADPDAASRHPVLRACHSTGLRSTIENAQILRLVTEALTQIDRPPCGDEQALFECLSAPGLAEVHLELSLDRLDIAEANGRYLGAASQLYGVILSFSPGGTPRLGEVPMNLLAKHNINTDDVEASQKQEKIADLLSDLLALNLAWFSEGLSALKLSPAVANGKSTATHVQLYWAMQKRQLDRINKNIAGFLKSGVRFGPADAWFAWRFVRKLT